MLPADAQLAEIRGRAVDVTTGALANAVVRLMPKDSTITKYRLVANRDGMFSSGDIVPGVYTLGISSQGFREQFVREVDLAPSQLKDVGAIVLEISGTCACLSRP